MPIYCPFSNILAKGKTSGIIAIPVFAMALWCSALRFNIFLAIASLKDVEI